MQKLEIILIETNLRVLNRLLKLQVTPQQIERRSNILKTFEKVHQLTIFYKSSSHSDYYLHKTIDQFLNYFQDVFNVFR